MIDFKEVQKYVARANKLKNWLDNEARTGSPVHIGFYRTYHGFAGSTTPESVLVDRAKVIPILEAELELLRGKLKDLKVVWE